MKTQEMINKLTEVINFLTRLEKSAQVPTTEFFMGKMHSLSEDEYARAQERAFKSMSEMAEQYAPKARETLSDLKQSLADCSITAKAPLTPKQIYQEREALIENLPLIGNVLRKFNTLLDFSLKAPEGHFTKAGIDEFFDELKSDIAHYKASPSKSQQWKRYPEIEKTIERFYDLSIDYINAFNEKE
jgi:hypothetical protein